ncbi:MAG: hypothetical protein KAJ52_08530, partial [Sedimentisphaerales bacterium]|nr:hypothetical protein [Sedimentisphaerales bacterium]
MKKKFTVVITLMLLVLIVSLSGNAWANGKDKPQSVLASERANQTSINRSGELRIIAFGAHPDD